MTKAKPVIRPATAKDLDVFYDGDLPKATVRAIVVDIDGDIAAVAGLGYCDDQMVAFSSMKDKLRGYPLTIMKTAKRFRSMLEQHGRNVYAIASSDEMNSDSFLERIGFSFIGDTTDGRAYRWQQQQSH